MKFTTVFAVAALALAEQAVATIITGTSTFTSGNLKGTTYDVAWIKGEDACQWTFLANGGDNPCGKKFTLSNGYTYYLTDCGDASFALHNGDGSYNHLAVYNPNYEKDDCVNNNGQYKVVKTWEF
ncbi:unnamed protein product [Aureobasidium uvarum]|uniref:Uncharacterized protein n=1 Tax=Aureobasidium uvarum TaxID=2773716 RepID=A0A9N8KHQ6_9PEZI|nr:unnamed protein product [Aureobasidium uvarum]